MNVTVKISGHQIYDEVTGEVLAWSTTVERFDGVPFQVPCVAVKTDRGVRVIPLKTEYTWTQIENAGASFEASRPNVPKNSDRWIDP